MKTRDRLFADKEFIGKLLKLTVPSAFQSLMLASVAAADAIMLGRLDQNAMSAVSLATQIQFVQNMFIMAATIGITILGAQYWGKKDLKSINQLFWIGLRVCGVVSILFFAGCMIIPRYLMMIFTNEEVLIGIGVKYLRIAGWSYLLTGISQCYQAIMKVTDHTDTTAKISSAAVIINIVMNAVLIFGLLGAPEMGVQGAAAATLIARIIELAVCLGISYRKTYEHPHMKYALSTNLLLLKDFVKCTIPLLLASLLWGVGFTSYSAFMGHMGTDAAAANSVSAVVRDLVCCLCNGIAIGGGIMIGNELGAGNLEKGKLYGGRICKIGILCGVASSLLMFAFTPLIMKFVKLTEGASRYLLGMMLIMGIYMIGRALNTVVVNGIFDCGGDTLFDMYSLAVTMWGIAVPLAIAGTFFLHWPVLVVYACTCLDEIGKIPWVMAHYKKYKWVKDLTRENV